MIDPSQIDLTTLPWLPLSAKSAFPRQPAIYFAIDPQGVVQYIGKSINPKQRWGGHHRYFYLQAIGEVRIAYLFVDAPELLPGIERSLIAWFNPPLNIQCKSFHTEKPVSSDRHSLKVILEFEVEGICAALKAARKKAKIGITQAGYQAGMSAANFARLESGNVKAIPITTLINAAKAVDLDLSLYLDVRILSLAAKN